MKELKIAQFRGHYKDIPMSLQTYMLILTLEDKINTMEEELRDAKDALEEYKTINKELQSANEFAETRVNDLARKAQNT